MLRSLSRILAAALVISATTQTVPAAEFGDVSVLAQVPVPNGFPEGLAVRDGRFYVAGPATFGTSINGKASRFFEFDLATGGLLRTIETQGEKVFGAEHANSCLAFDGQGQLYVLNNQLGTLRFTSGTLQQSNYTSPFPNDPACLPLGLSGGKSCSPTVTNMPALPNDLAFDDAGFLYVTDSMQATIWRIPPGGGAPQAWFRDFRFASPYIGVNGLRLSPDRGQLFITVTTDMLGFGRIYTLPLKDKPTKDDLKVWHNFAPGDGPDGIAFGASGKLYVTLALPGKSGIAILEPDGTESARIMNPPLSLISPFDSPANVAFDGQGNLLVTNHAFATGLLIPHQFQVLKVYVNDVAEPPAEPIVP